MKIKHIIIGLLLFSLPAVAQDELSKVATSMGQFLKLGAGARGTALGDAYTSLTNDVSAMYWNPAGIQKIGHPALGVARTQLYAGITYNYLGLTYPVNANTTIGVSVLYLNSGDMELTTIDEPEGTGQTFDAASTGIGFTVSRHLTPRFDLGITVRYISERLYREEASTIAFDIGSQFDTGIYGIKLGMALLNFGGKMKLDGPDLDLEYINDRTGTEYDAGSRLKTEEWPIPLIYRMGISVDILGANSEIIKDEKNRLTAVLEANDPTDHFLRYNTGLEYEWSKFIAFRLGYKLNYDEARFTAGLGMDFSQFGINARLDYAFNDYGILGYVHNYSFEFGF